MEIIQLAESKILVVEDDPHVASFVLRGLTEEGYKVSVAPDGRLGLQIAATEGYHVILLDVMLPGTNGIEVCKQLRQRGVTTPILMLTALGSTDNIVTGLDSGADDYLAKPFKFAELLARIRSLLRRHVQPAEDNKASSLSIAGLELNPESKLVRQNGELVTLTATEYRLLEYFMRNQRKVLSRLDILEQVWGIDFDMSTNVVDVYINYLRKKINKQGQPKLIQTVIGMGYIMKE